MYTPEDSPFEKFRTEKLKGVAMSPDVLELVAKAYEGGFIDGMQKQMQSSVDRAVNRMAEQPAQQQKPVSLDDISLVCLPHAYPGAAAFAKGWNSALATLAERGPLYTSPPASKPQPLTDEEIKRLKPISADFVSFRAGVRCMEREYGIGAKR